MACFRTSFIILLIIVNLIMTKFKFSIAQEGTNESPGSAIATETINAAAQDAMVNLQRLNELESDLRSRGLTTRRGSASSFHQALFRADPQELAEKRWSGLVETETALSLSRRLLEAGVVSRVNNIPLENTEVGNVCPKPPVCPPTRYRTLDGSCNNLENLSWGKSFIALQRLMTPIYDDGLNTPRQKGVDNGPLPSPREISTKLSPDVDVPSKRFTTLLMQWGQFIDHDVTNTALSTAGDGAGITCCDEEVRRNQSLLHPACFAITIPDDDPFYSQFQQTCMEFVRSEAAPRAKCTLGPRDQLNTLTSFIDGSMIYGSTLNESLRLRSLEGGKLKGSPTHGADVLPPDPETACISEDLRCFAAGDARVNEQTLLTAMHQIWFREHNRISESLLRLNPGWNDEILYYESRRIVGAMIQHITYNEFLPALLDQRVMGANKLYPQNKGFNLDYDPKINPTLSNVFATAAYRLGHSLVQGLFQLLSQARQVTDNLVLSTQFFNPVVLYGDEAFDQIVRGMASQEIQKFDKYFSNQLTQHLFQPPGVNFGLDLVSLNIQRGRDHGLQGYNRWREFCKLKRIESFDELGTVMDPDAAKIFSQLYRHVNDIDLFPAGVSESQLSDSLLPPTFACLVAEQFHRLKFGDRFYYENGNMESSFRENQLQEIRKVTLARVLCDNTKIGSVQKNAMFVTNRRNPLQPCVQGSIPRMSLDPWRNEPVWA